MIVEYRPRRLRRLGRDPRQLLAETRSVDDQAAWLDDSTLAYAQQHEDGAKDLWSVPADGSGEPGKLVRDAHSPAMLG